MGITKYSVEISCDEFLEVPLCFDEIRHAIQPRGLPLTEKFGGGQSTLREQGAVVGLVLEGNGLVGGADDDLMLTHDVAHADGVDADLVGGTLAEAVSAVVNGGVGAHLAKGVGNGQSRAAGRVQLARPACGCGASR